MQQLKLVYSEATSTKKAYRIQVGVVSSGDLEVLFSSEGSETELTVEITSSADNSEKRWKDLFNRLYSQGSLAAGRMEIHDFAATPGVARLRIEQAMEKVFYA